VRLFTGGNALRQAQGLFDASASLTTESGAYTNTLSDWDVIYWGQAFIPFQPAASPLPPQYVGLGALGTLGNDGHLFKVESSGSEIVMTLTAPAASFTGQLPLVQKHTPYITLSTATIANANLATNTPEVCVGQQVKFELDWDSAPPGIVDTNQHWTLPLKFVNQPYQYSDACASYQLNTDLLTNNPTWCWYVNLPGGRVSMWQNLHFSNGQYVSIAAAGSFTIYRPRIWLAPPVPGQTQPYYTISDVIPNPIGTCKLKLGENDQSGNGDMKFYVNVNSKFDGQVGLTQLITANYPNPLYNFSDERCDGIEFYDGPRPVNGRPNPNIVCGFVSMDDGPFSIWVSPNWVDLSSQDFVRFQPGGGIYVTLGIVTWDTVGTAQTFGGDWSITDDATSGPNCPDGSDEFPLWTVNQGGMH